MITEGQLTDQLRQASTYIQDHYWIKKNLTDGYGGVDILGALRRTTGDGAPYEMLYGLLTWLGRAEIWNDEPSTRRADITGFLDTHIVTDGEMTQVYGPHWRQIAHAVEQGSEITNDQMTELATIWERREASLDWHECWYQSMSRGTYPRSLRAGTALRNAVWKAAIHLPAGEKPVLWNPAGRAATAAAGALALQDDLPADAFEKLYLTWRCVFGAPLPEVAAA